MFAKKFWADLKAVQLQNELDEAKRNLQKAEKEYDLAVKEVTVCKADLTTVSALHIRKMGRAFMLMSAICFCLGFILVLSGHYWLALITVPPFAYSMDEGLKFLKRGKFLLSTMQRQ